MSRLQSEDCHCPRGFPLWDACGERPGGGYPATSLTRMTAASHTLRDTARLGDRLQERRRQAQRAVWGPGKALYPGQLLVTITEPQRGLETGTSPTFTPGTAGREAAVQGGELGCLSGHLWPSHKSQWPGVFSCAIITVLDHGGALYFSFFF